LTELSLRELLAALHGGGVRFIVIGGVAVGAHGYVRATEDLDIVPDPEPENLKRLSAALEELGATLPTARDRRFRVARDESALHMGRSLTLDTSVGALDVVQRVPGVPPYPTLEDDAIASDLLGVPVRICSLAHLREMKRARGTKQDEADLEALP
jgi:hypothetical protein